MRTSISGGVGSEISQVMLASTSPARSRTRVRKKNEIVAPTIVAVSTLMNTSAVSESSVKPSGGKVLSQRHSM